MTSHSAAWSVAQVVDWLGKNECGDETLRACESNKVDGATLCGLSKGDIKDELCISSIGERKKLWALVEGLKGKAVSPERLARDECGYPPPLHSPAAGSPARSLRRSSLAESVGGRSGGRSEGGGSELGDLDAVEEWSKRLWADDTLRQEAIKEAATKQAHRAASAQRERERQKAQDLCVAEQLLKEADARRDEREGKEKEEERIAEAGQRLQSRRSLTPKEGTDSVPSWRARELADADAEAKHKVCPHPPPAVPRPGSAGAEAQKAREQLRAEQRLVQVSKQHRDAVFEEERRRRTDREGLGAAERDRREAMRKEMQRRQEAAVMEAAWRLPPMQGAKETPIAIVPGMPVRTALGDAWIVERYSGGHNKLRDFWWVEMQDGAECLFAAGGVVPRRGGAVKRS